MTDRFQKFRELRALPSTALRIYFFAFLMLGGLGVLAAKLWQEQMVRSEKWRSRIKTSGETTVRIPSVRGDILDRNGWVLSENRASFGVDLYLPEMVEALREKNRGVKGWKMPTLKREVTRDGNLRLIDVPDIVTIFNEEVRPRLLTLGLTEDDPSVDLNYNAVALETHYRSREHVPFEFLGSVKFDSVAKICENDLGLPGVEPTPRPVRTYLYGAFACHMLGHVGKPMDEVKEPDYLDANGNKKFSFYKSDIVGKEGLEKYADKWLRGKPGVRVLERSAKGKIGAEIRREEPTRGYNVYLTIDARIQMMAERTLRDAGVGRAAVVVVDPNNGDVLAMASVPNYDANMFTAITEEQLDAFEDDKTSPNISRCTESYPPGSTYKQVTALALLRSGMSPNRTYSCSGSVPYGGRRMKCTGSHGPLNLWGAIKKSCNCYFYQSANDIGENSKDGFAQIEAVGEALGLGMRSGLPISGEDPGALPGPKYYASKGLMAEMDSGGQLANAAIGQGKVVASPLQMAMVTATMANGGKSFYPRLISRVAEVVDNERYDVRNENNELVAPAEGRLRANLLDIGLKESDIEVVRRGMWQVVNAEGGTGKRARIKGIEVAGKTGTAQAYRLDETKEKDANGKPKLEKKSDYRVWFCSFAPYKDPKYAICVMVETGGDQGSGGKIAAPIATRIMKEALALIALDKTDEANAKFRPEPLAAVAGNFTPLSAVELKDDGTLTKIVAAGFEDQAPGAPRADDDDRTDRDDHAPVVKRKSNKTNVVAKKAADARGTVKPADKPVRQPNIFERLFGRKPSAAPAAGTPPRTR